MKDLMSLPFGELMGMITDENYPYDKFIVGNGLMIACKCYSQAKTAFFATKKYCMLPYYGLLELMLSYADFVDIPELLEIYENEDVLKRLEDDEVETFFDRAIKKFDQICLPILNHHDCSIANRRYNYGIPTIVKIYNIAPEECYSKKKAIDKLIENINYLLTKPEEATKHRLSVVVELEICHPKIDKLKSKASEMIITGAYRTKRRKKQLY